MSLRNGMWHGLRNGIIMRNEIYVQNDSNKQIKLKIAPFFGANQFTSSRFLNVAGSTTITMKKPGRTP